MAVIIYVSPLGSNTSPYDTWAKAANLPSTAITYGNSVADTKTYYIAPGPYTSTFDLSNANQVNSLFIGTVEHGSITPAGKGDVLISNAGKVLSVTKSGIRLENLTFTGGDSSNNLLSLSGADFYAYNCYLYDAVRKTFSTSTGGNNWTFEKCLILGCGRYTSDTPFNIVTPGTFINSIFDQDMLYASSSASYSLMVLALTGTVVFKHCFLDGYPYRAISVTSGTVEFDNTYVGAPYQVDGNYTLAKSGTGVINAYNSMLMSPYASSDKLITGGELDVDSNNLKITQPGITKRKRTGIIVPCIDDSANAAYAHTLASTFSSRNKKGSLFVEANNLATYLSDIQLVQTDGVFEIGCHSYSHSDLSLTGNIYSITKVGSTINIDRINNQIVVDTGGTVTSFKLKTLAAIKTELEGFGCTIGTLQTGLLNVAKGEIMADSSGAQASPYTPQLLIDVTGATGYYKSEVVDALSLLNSTLGISATSFATPGGTTNANTEVAVAAGGFWGCRSDRGSKFKYVY